MFSPEVYANRRAKLRSRMSTGIVVLVGNDQSPINYAHNVYPFRQDSTFLYFIGIDRPHLAAVIDLDSNEELVFGDDPAPDELIWSGEAPSVSELAAMAGCSGSKPYSTIADVVGKAVRSGRRVHIVPPYRIEARMELARWCDIELDRVVDYASPELIRSTVELREIKEAAEIEEIERALGVTRSMHLAAMEAIRPGLYEYEVVARMREVLGRGGMCEAYAPVFSMAGHILHNARYDNQLRTGDLVVNDYGASSPLGYASDVTRTLPVGGQFSPGQRELYEILHYAQQAAIAVLRPGVRFSDAHRLASRCIVEGMKDLGFFNGNVNDVVESGAYAICFPHGLGHQMGLDVHDMESLGEDMVGYGSDESRSPVFGLRNLRLAKPMKQGMITTVEPGIYFIPALIRQWKLEGRHADLINYEVLENYASFGGMRIEDDVLITSNACRVLGPPIPRSASDIEAAMRG